MLVTSGCLVTILAVTVTSCSVGTSEESYDRSLKRSFTSRDWSFERSKRNAFRYSVNYTAQLGPPSKKDHCGNPHKHKSTHTFKDVKIEPYFLVEPKDKTVMYGGLVLLRCCVGGYPPPRVTWSKEGGDMPVRKIISQTDGIIMTDVDETTAGRYTCSAYNDLKKISKTITLTVKKTCPAATIQTSGIGFFFEEGLAYLTVYSKERCDSGYPQASVVCSLSPSTNTYVYSVTTLDYVVCDNGTIQDIISKVILSNRYSVEEALLQLDLKTSIEKSFSQNDSILVSNFLYEISSHDNTTSEEMYERILNIADHVTAFIQSQPNPTYDATNEQLLQVLTVVGSHVDLSRTNSSFTFLTPNIAAEVQGQNKGSQGVSYEPEVYLTVKGGGLQKPVFISLPAEVFKQANNSRVTFLLTRITDPIKPDSNSSWIVSADISGKEVANLSDPVKITFNYVNDTKDDIKLNGSEYAYLSKRCVYFDNVTEDWSTDGCCMVADSNPVQCKCNHLTNFAFKFGFDIFFLSSLSFSSKIGCYISLASFMIIAALLHFYVKKKTNKKTKENADKGTENEECTICLTDDLKSDIDKMQPSYSQEEDKYKQSIHKKRVKKKSEPYGQDAILIPIKSLRFLCGNLGFSYAAFVTGLDNRGHGNACFASSVAQHLFLLSTGAWMVMYSLSIFLVCTVEKSSKWWKKFSIATAVASFTFSTAFTVANSIVSSLKPKQGQNPITPTCENGLNPNSKNPNFLLKNACYPEDTSLYFTLLLPGGLFALLYVVLLLAAISKSSAKSQFSESMKLQFWVAVVLGSLVGITWTFGYLLLMSDNIKFFTTMNWVFTAAVCLKACAMTLLILCGDKEIRSFLSEKFRKLLKRLKCKKSVQNKKDKS